MASELLLVCSHLFNAAYASLFLITHGIWSLRAHGTFSAPPQIHLSPKRLQAKTNYWLYLSQKSTLLEFKAEWGRNASTSSSHYFIRLDKTNALTALRLQPHYCITLHCWWQALKTPTQYEDGEKKPETREYQKISSSKNKNSAIIYSTSSLAKHSITLSVAHKRRNVYESTALATKITGILRGVRKHIFGQIKPSKTNWNQQKKRMILVLRKYTGV